MNRLVRNGLAALIALLLCASLFGCSLVSVDEDKDRAQVVAKVGDIEITKGEYLDYFNSALSQQGMSASSLGGMLESFQDYVMDTVIYQKVQEYKAAQEGYDKLSEADQKTLEDEINSYIGYIEETAKAQAETELTSNPGLDVDKRAAELFATVAEEQVFGEALSKEEATKKLEGIFKPELVIAAKRAAFDKTVTVTDEEVQAAFDEQLKSDQEAAKEASYASGYKANQEAYEQGNGTPPLVVPQGYIRVKVISILSGEEPGADYTDLKTEMQELSDELAKLTLEDEAANAARLTEIKQDYAQKKAQADQILAALYAPLRQKADQAYAKLQSGTGFDAVMSEYTEDESFATATSLTGDGKTEENPFLKTGVLLSRDSAEFSEQVRDAALKLAAPGSYTGVVQDDAGLHILQLVGAETPGERKLADYKEAFTESALTAKQEDEWNAMVDEWSKDTTLVTRYEEKYRDVGKS